jgi:hypothetical protein
MGMSWSRRQLQAAWTFDSIRQHLALCCLHWHSHHMAFAGHHLAQRMLTLHIAPASSTLGRGNSYTSKRRCAVTIISARPRAPTSHLLLLPVCPLTRPADGPIVSHKFDRYHRDIRTAYSTLETWTMAERSAGVAPWQDFSSPSRRTSSTAGRTNK